jgi:multisubunit Na+/H+ antiporter MnhE subunit
LSGSWYYWSTLRALPPASLFALGQFVFKVIFGCIVSVFVRNVPRNQLFLACKRSLMYRLLETWKIISSGSTMAKPQNLLSEK